MRSRSFPERERGSVRAYHHHRATGESAPRYRRNPVVPVSLRTPWVRPRTSQGAQSKNQAHLSQESVGGRPVDGRPASYGLVETPCRSFRSGRTPVHTTQCPRGVCRPDRAFALGASAARTEARAQTSQAALWRNSRHPTTPRRHRNRKNRTSLASPGKSVLSTSNNAAMDPCVRRSTTSSSVDVRRWRLCTTLEEPVSICRPILPEPLLIDKDFGPLL